MVMPFRVLKPSQLGAHSKPIEWIWPGVLGTQCITLLTSEGKDGKTTLLSVLMARLHQGGTVAGKAVRPTRVVVFTEEAEAVWDERSQRLGYSDECVEIICSPFLERPSTAKWDDTILALAEEPPGLLVFDPLAMFVPGRADHFAPAVIDALRPLRLLTSLGWAIALLHHPTKQRRRGMLVERWSTALKAFVDVVVTLDVPLGARSERVRRLRALSRPFGFNENYQIEMLPDGSDYVLVPPEDDPSRFEAGWVVLKSMFEDTEVRLSRRDLLHFWLEDFDKPSMPTLRRWLERAEREGLIVRTGTGRYQDPYRYALWGRTFEDEDNRKGPPDYR